MLVALFAFDWLLFVLGAVMSVVSLILAVCVLIVLGFVLICLIFICFVGLVFCLDVLLGGCLCFEVGGYDCGWSGLFCLGFVDWFGYFVLWFLDWMFCWVGVLCFGFRLVLLGGLLCFGWFGGYFCFGVWGFGFYVLLCYAVFFVW